MYITGKRSWFLIISEAVILIGIIALLVFGLKPGVEFSSGSILTISFDEEVEQSELATAMTELGYANSIIQRTGGGDFIIRTQELSGEERMGLEDALSYRFGTATEREFYSVSPMVAAETARNAIIAVGIAA
ncbi:MAG: protein translocase subunit SecF, partial [Dehalococcoidia bacterium]